MKLTDILHMQVEYLLTDKTGTLTQNQMEFRQCSVDGRKYVEVNAQLRMATDDSARFFHDHDDALTVISSPIASITLPVY